jgi:Tfp pilus assembly protein PilF
MRYRLAILGVVGWVLALGLAREAALAAEPAAEGKPPWQRLLQGADQNRAAELRGQVGAAWQAGKWAEAVQAAEQLLELRQKVQGKDHWQAVNARWLVQAMRAAQRQSKEAQKEYAGLRTLEDQAGMLLARGLYRDAQALLEQGLRINRKVLGEEHPLTAASYNNVAATLHAQGKYGAAEEGYRKALVITRKVFGEEHPSTADCYNNVAANLNAQGQYAAAEDLYRKALEIRRKVLGEEDSDTAASHNNLAGNLQGQGHYAAAEEGFRKALAIRRKVLGEEHPETAASHENLAGILRAQGQYAAAAEGSRKALAIRRKVLGEEHPLTAASYTNVAANLNAQGQCAAAAEGFRKALDIFRKVLGEEHPHTAIGYSWVGTNLHDQGEYAAAAEFYRKGLDIQRKVLGEEHPDTAIGYNNVAFNLNAQGQYAAAEENYRKARDIFRKVLGEQHPRTADSYNNLAANWSAQDQYAAAEEGYRKALGIRRKVLGEEHPSTANSYHNVASILQAQGKYAEAECLWGRAATAFTSARPRLASSGLERATATGKHSPLPHLAAVLARNGKTAQAWQRYEESLSRGTWDDLSARLRRPAAQQATQAALVTRLDRLDKLIEKVATLEDETPQQKKDREDLLGQRLAVQEELDAFVAHLEKDYGPVAGQVFDIPRIQKALADDMAVVGWLDLPPAGPKAADPNGEHWAFLLRSQGEPRCVRLRGSGAGDAWTDEDSQLAGDLRSAALECRGGWQRLAHRLAQQRLGPLGKHLAADDGLPPVKHLVVLPSGSLAGVPVELLAEGCTVSYAHSGTLLAHLRSLPKVRTAGLFAMADPVFEAPTKASKEKPLPPRGVLLTVVPRGSNAAIAGLQPDDVLLKYGEVELQGPADLKPEPESDDAGRRIVLSVWRSGKTVELRIRPGNLGVLLASKPAPEALRDRHRLDTVLAGRSGTEDWRELPGTRVEVQALLRLFAEKPQLMVLFDAEASEQNLYALAQSGELKKYRYLHLATHSDVDDRFPLRSAVILSRANLPDPGQQLLEGKPLFDGRLTAEEVLRQWNLDCDLVTLSACQTALGKYERGEGFVGFAQALILCGSRSVCLSLWKVDDAATALLMQRFYANLLGKREGLKAPLPKAAALAEAKRWLRTLPRTQALKQAAALYQGIERGKGRTKLPVVPALPETKEDCPYAHPYYWAAFVLTGDPQ